MLTVSRTPETGREAIIGEILYVGNLSEAATEDELKELFAEAGEVVEATISNDRSSGRPSGFAQIEMADEIDAVTALHLLEGREIHSQRIQVSRLPLVAHRPSSNGGADSRPTSRRRKSKGSRRGVRGRKRRL